MLLALCQSGSPVVGFCLQKLLETLLGVKILDDCPKRFTRSPYTNDEQSELSVPNTYFTDITIKGPMLPMLRSSKAANL